MGRACHHWRIMLGNSNRRRSNNLEPGSKAGAPAQVPLKIKNKHRSKYDTNSGPIALRNQAFFSGSPKTLKLPFHSQKIPNPINKQSGTYCKQTFLIHGNHLINPSGRLAADTPLFQSSQLGLGITPFFLIGKKPCQHHIYATPALILLLP